MHMADIKITPEMQAIIDAQVAATLAARASGRVSFKVTEKGGVSAYGLGRFPVTLYGSQWAVLLSNVEPLKAFLKANADKLATKPAK
jgi:hypothetical protein